MQQQRGADADRGALTAATNRLLGIGKRSHELEHRRIHVCRRIFEKVLKACRQ